MYMSRTNDPLAPHPVLKDYYENEAQRKSRVKDLFDSSASHYDWITDMMSFGSGRWYREQALVRAGCKSGLHVIDVGAGTGVVSWLAQKLVGSEGQVVALDPSKGMLTEAKKLGVHHATQGFGEALPFREGNFDMLTMGYALRHVSDLREAFSEYFRVLKPGGTVLLLEISRPEGKITTALLKFYLKVIIPSVSRVFRRSKNAQVLMQYYWDTIENCVRPDVIVNELKEAGFKDVKRHVAMGVFSEYTGVKS